MILILFLSKGFQRVLLLLLNHFSCIRLYVATQMAAHQAPLSLGFSRQEYWSGLPFLSPVHACMLLLTTSFIVRIETVTVGKTKITLNCINISIHFGIEQSLLTEIKTEVSKHFWLTTPLSKKKIMLLLIDQVQKLVLLDCLLSGRCCYELNSENETLEQCSCEFAVAPQGASVHSNLRIMRFKS